MTKNNFLFVTKQLHFARCYHQILRWYFLPLMNT